jgi:hypothetical protein
MDDWIRRHRELNPHIYENDDKLFKGVNTQKEPTPLWFTVKIIDIDGELGFIIPDEIVKEFDLKEDQDITIEVDENIMRVYFD